MGRLLTNRLRSDHQWLRTHEKALEPARIALIALLKEKQEYGYIRDSAGKRYRVGVFYLLAGEVEKALAYYAWFKQEFPDDVGEPIFDLYWALAAYRAGHLNEASVRLQSAMLQNVYMLPALFNEPLEELDIWHASNQVRPEYLREVEAYLAEPSAEERSWMKSAFYSESFSKLRQGYITTYRALNHERDIARRRAILRDWYAFKEQFFK